MRVLKYWFVPPSVPDKYASVGNCWEVTETFGENGYTHYVDFLVMEPCTNGIDDDSRILKMQIKWDGCTHTFLGEEDNYGYFHTCHPTDFENLFWLIRALHARAKEVMDKTEYGTDFSTWEEDYITDSNWRWRSHDWSSNNCEGL